MRFGTSRQKTRGLWARYRRHLRDRYRLRLSDESGRYRAALRHTRALVIAEALAFLIVAFTIDELRVLRWPAFLVGIIGAVLILVFAGMLHGAGLHRVTKPLRADEARARFSSFRSTGRGALFVVVLGGLVWFVFFTSGVPPWVA